MGSAFAFTGFSHLDQTCLKRYKGLWLRIRIRRGIGGRGRTQRDISSRVSRQQASSADSEIGAKVFPRHFSPEFVRDEISKGSSVKEGRFLIVQIAHAYYPTVRDDPQKATESAETFRRNRHRRRLPQR